MFEAFTFAGEASEHQTALSNGNSEVFERARERKDKYIWKLFRNYIQHENPRYFHNKQLSVKMI